MSNPKRLISRSYLKNSNGSFSQDKFLMVEGTKILAAFLGLFLIIAATGCETDSFNGSPADGDRYERDSEKCQELPEWCQQ
jgi:hypothetical protein